MPKAWKSNRKKKKMRKPAKNPETEPDSVALAATRPHRVGAHAANKKRVIAAQQGKSKRQKTKCARQKSKTNCLLLEPRHVDIADV